MKEQLHTIPISDAMANAGECPFCYIEQKTEEHMMDFVLGHGASYMEADIRDMTDQEGFCRAHFKKMFDYGNSLGNAWILKTLMKRHEEEMDHVWKTFRPDAAAKRSSLFGKKTDGSSNSIVEWINRRESTCFICNSVKNTFQAYMKTFFSMYKKMWISVHRWQIPKDSASITLKFSAKVPTNSFPVKRKKNSMPPSFL